MSHLPSPGSPVWPDPPLRWSYSSARSILACPRQWALRPRPVAAAGCSHRQALTWPLLRGLASHAVLELMIKVHCEKGGPPARDVALARFWHTNLPKSTSQLIRDAIEAQLARATEPEAALDLLRACAHREERSLVQFVNAKTTFALSLLGVPAGRTTRPESTHTEAIGQGANAEVILEALLGSPSKTSWRGDADLIVVRDTDVVIADYKTGAEDVSHRDQLELYALLFARDRTRNPSGLRAKELALLYWSGREERWPAPDDTALVSLEERWSAEVERVRRAFASGPPPAYVTEEGCARCDVRGSCDEYWREGVALTSSRCDDRLLQVQSMNRDGAELICGEAAPGKRAVRLLVPQRWRQLTRALPAGTQLRVTNIVAGHAAGENQGTTLSLMSKSTMTVL